MGILIIVFKLFCNKQVSEEKEIGGVINYRSFSFIFKTPLPPRRAGFLLFKKNSEKRFPNPTKGKNRGGGSLRLFFGLLPRIGNVMQNCSKDQV